MRHTRLGVEIKIEGCSVTKKGGREVVYSPNNGFILSLCADLCCWASPEQRVGGCSVVSDPYCRLKASTPNVFVPCIKPHLNAHGP